MYNRLEQETDIRVRSHGLRQLVDNIKSVANFQQTCCMQVDCQHLSFTDLQQVTSLQIEVATSR